MTKRPIAVTFARVFRGMESGVACREYPTHYCRLITNNTAVCSAALSALSVIRMIAMPFWVLGGKLPPRIGGMLVDAIPSRRVQCMKHIVRTMRERSEEIIAEKRAALQKGDESTVRQVSEGKDIMSILRT